MISRKILIITYYWPPSGGVGVQRWMNFSLQLADKGWEPIILTPENPQFELKDQKLVERVRNLRTFRIPIWEPFQLFHQLTGGKERKSIKQGLVMEKTSQSLKDKVSIWIRGNLLIPDPRVFWVKKASDFAIDLIKKEAISTIITTGPPHSIHLIGKRVKKKTNIKWLADFRDPWSKWDILDKLNTSEVVMYLHKQLEASVLDQADKTITVSNRLAKSLGSAEVVNNGVSINQAAEEQPDPERFTIGYFGMLNELRNPAKLWMMLDQICREDPVFSAKLKLKIGGIVSESITAELSRFDELKSKVEYLGYRSHEEVQVEYQTCNVLLLLLNKSDNAQWILPVKFFEYLSANRLVLCLGPKESDLGDIMKKNEVGEIFSYNDIVGIRAFVEDCYEGNRKPSVQDVEGLISRFSHQHLAEKLDGVLKSMINE